MKRVTLAIIFVVVLLISGCFVPYSSETTPAWTVTIVDATGKPLAGVDVEQFWRNEALEDYQTVLIKTDPKGMASFPARATKASLVQRGLGIVSFLTPRVGRLAKNVVSFQISSAGFKKELFHQPSGVVAPGGRTLTLTLQPFDLFRDVAGNDSNFFYLALRDNPALAQIRDVAGNTLLHHTLKTIAPLRTSMAVTLLQAGADINAVNLKGETTLHLAVAANDLAFVQWLLKNNARRDIVDQAGVTPLQLAQTFQSAAMIEAFSGQRPTGC